MDLRYLEHVSVGIAALGVLVILWGVLRGVVDFLRTEWSAGGRWNEGDDRRRLRSLLGYYLLLGLEFLIAADIIDTLMKPTTHELIGLGAVVAIRTVISYSLNSELSHEAQRKTSAATP